MLQLKLKFGILGIWDHLIWDLRNLGIWEFGFKPELSTVELRLVFSQNIKKTKKQQKTPSKSMRQINNKPKFNSAQLRFQPTSTAIATATANATATVSFVRIS